jgi:hypothetical protein
VWEPVEKVMAEAFLGRELTKTEEVRLKDAKAGLRLENLEVYDSATKAVLDVKTESEKTTETELEVSK